MSVPIESKRTNYSSRPSDTENRFAQIDRAQIYADNNQYKRAIPPFEKTLAATGQSDAKEKQRLKIKAGTFYADALSRDGRQREAEAAMTRTVEDAEKLLAAYPNDSIVRRQVRRTFSITSSL